MNQTISNTKQLGKITSITSGEEDRGIITCWVQIEFIGSGQGFGGLVLDENLLIKFEQELCNTFDVSTVKELVGLQCYALRNFDAWQESIVGLSSYDTGKKFTLNAFREKHCGFRSDNLKERKKELNIRIEMALRTIERTSIELKDLESKYTDWDK